MKCVKDCNSIRITTLNRDYDKCITCGEEVDAK